MVDRLTQPAPRRPARVSAGSEVLLHGEVRKAVPTLEHLNEALAREPRRTARANGLSAEGYGASPDFTPLGGEQPRRRLEGRALAGTVRPEQRHDRSLGN